MASLALTITYRKGLLPILKGGLGTISGAVDALKEESEKAESAAREILSSAAEKLEYAEAALTELSARLLAIENELKATREENEKIADLRTLLGVQVDLLHDVFMASSLPYYRKEEVGERVAEMKKALTRAEGGVNE